MKKKTKGIIVFAFIGGIMITSGVTIAIPGIAPQDESEQVTVTGTPEDNFPDEEREQFCGTGSVKSNQFVKEYKIPTSCTQPLAITTDAVGNVWFAQVNTGKVAKFDPSTETFSEYDNPFWPDKGRSMMWGIDYSADGSIWFTDESFDTIWKFMPQEERYQPLQFPSEGDSLPQKLVVDGSRIIVNDFTGNKLVIFDPTQSEEELSFLSIPSPVEDSVTAGFAIDNENNIWYTNWIFQQEGVLVKFDQEEYSQALATSSNKTLPLTDFVQVFKLPSDLETPNGATIDKTGKIWLAGTSSSSIFEFDPDTEVFTNYITSEPHPLAFGNSSGAIKAPISRPYWIDITDDQKLVFNEQTANRIGVLDIQEDRLVEYMIPSRNPNWADCEGMEDCGLAQAFDFTISGDKIWFTEWVENNIGVVDTTVTLPFSIEPSDLKVTLSPGASISLTVSGTSSIQGNLDIVSNPKIDSPVTITSVKDTIDVSGSFEFPITVHASQDAQTGSYKGLVGLQNSEIAISQYITIDIKP